MSQIVYWVIGILICGAIIGLLCVVVDKAPFVPAEYKQTAKAVIMIGGILLLIFALLSLLSGRALFIP